MGDGRGQHYLPHLCRLVRYNCRSDDKRVIQLADQLQGYTIPVSARRRRYANGKSFVEFYVSPYKSHESFTFQWRAATELHLPE